LLAHPQRRGIRAVVERLEAAGRGDGEIRGVRAVVPGLDRALRAAEVRCAPGRVTQVQPDQLELLAASVAARGHAAPRVEQAGQVVPVHGAIGERVAAQHAARSELEQLDHRVAQPGRAVRHDLPQQVSGLRRLHVVRGEVVGVERAAVLRERAIEGARIDAARHRAGPDEDEVVVVAMRAEVAPARIERSLGGPRQERANPGRAEEERRGSQREQYAAAQRADHGRAAASTKNGLDHAAPWSIWSTRR